MMSINTMEAATEYSLQFTHVHCWVLKLLLEKWAREDHGWGLAELKPGWSPFWIVLCCLSILRLHLNYLPSYAKPVELYTLSNLQALKGSAMQISLRWPASDICLTCHPNYIHDLSILRSFLQEMYPAHQVEAVQTLKPYQARHNLRSSPFNARSVYEVCSISSCCWLILSQTYLGTLD